MPLQRRVAIVGGGPCGLAAARHALLNGFDVQLFDRRNALGGRWNSLKSGQAPYLPDSTKMQYSSALSVLSDFPPLIDPTHAMTQQEAANYLLSYAKIHTLNKVAKLETEVVDIRRHADYEQNGKWIVKHKNLKNDTTKEETFDVVLVCSGWKQAPWRPNSYRLESNFKGRISHASDFKSTVNYKNKTVVLVGFGNSAANIARALGSVAEKVYISTRKSEWSWKQFNSSGNPFDLAYNNRLHHALRCMTPKYVRNFNWERQSINTFDYGQQRPDHRFLATLPVFVDELKELMESGRLQMVDSLISFTETGVEFKSGTALSDVDEVIFCTGYQFDFKVVENGRLVAVNDNDFQAYLHMYPVELRDHPTLGFIGFIQPQLGSVWPLAELQARVFFEVLRGTVKLPTTFDMRADAEWRRCCMNLDYVRTRRHTHIEDFVCFSNELSSLINARPALTSLIADPILAWHYYTGPLTSYHHRLSARHAWPGARNAIISTSQQANSRFSTMFLIPLLLVLLVFLLKVTIY